MKHDLLGTQALYCHLSGYSYCTTYPSKKVGAVTRARASTPTRAIIIMCTLSRGGARARVMSQSNAWKTVVPREKTTAGAANVHA